MKLTCATLAQYLELVNTNVNRIATAPNSARKDVNPSLLLPSLGLFINRRDDRAEPLPITDSCEEDRSGAYGQFVVGKGTSEGAAVFVNSPGYYGVMVCETTLPPWPDSGAECGKYGSMH